MIPIRQDNAEETEENVMLVELEKKDSSKTNKDAMNMCQEHHKEPDEETKVTNPSPHDEKSGTH